MPVLSEAITVQLPSDSADFSFRTITCFLAILFDAIVSAIVSASGKPSGSAETAKAITVSKSVSGSLPRKTSKTVMASATIKTIIEIWRENFSMRIVSGDFSSSVVARLSAILPSSVSSPMPTTTASARPDTTAVPEKAILICAEIAAFFVSISPSVFSIWTDSPVRIDSSTMKLWTFTRRMSAEILSPDSSKT